MTINSEMLISLPKAAPQGRGMDIKSHEDRSYQGGSKGAETSHSNRFKEYLKQETNSAKAKPVTKANSAPDTNKKPSQVNTSSAGSKITNPNGVAQKDHVKDSLDKVTDKLTTKKTTVSADPDKTEVIGNHTPGIITETSKPNLGLIGATKTEEYYDPTSQVKEIFAENQKTIKPEDSGNAAGKADILPKTDGQQFANSLTENAATLTASPIIAPPPSVGGIAPETTTTQSNNSIAPPAEQKPVSQAVPTLKDLASPQHNSSKEVDPADPRVPVKGKTVENITLADDQTYLKADATSGDAQPIDIVNASAEQDNIKDSSVKSAHDDLELLIVPSKPQETVTLPPQEQIAQPESQQIAAVSPPQNEAENTVAIKDVGTLKGTKKDDGREAGNLNNIAAADRKKTDGHSSAMDNKGSDQNTTEGKTSAEASQAKADTTGTQNASLSKTPFLTDLNQIMSNIDSKSTQSGSPLPQEGLLALQEVSQNGSQMNASQAANTKLATPQLTPQMVTNQINLAIAKHTGDGQNTFHISLKPVELGQVDIKLDFHAGRHMSATVTVDNDRTLNLLQRDQGALEKALENAGFTANGNNLNFSLKKQHHHAENNYFANGSTVEEETDDISYLPNNIVSRQQIKMAYSDNALDINI